MFAAGVGKCDHFTEVQTVQTFWGVNPVKNDRGTNVVQTVGPENPVKNDRGTNGTNDAIVVVNPVQTKKRPRYKRGTNGRSRYKRKNFGARNNGDFLETPLDTRRGTPKTRSGTNGGTNQTFFFQT